MISPIMAHIMNAYSTASGCESYKNKITAKIAEKDEKIKTDLRYCHI